MVAEPNLGLWIILTNNLEQGVVAKRDETATIPNLGLSSVDADATVDPQLPGLNPVQLASPLRL